MRFRVRVEILGFYELRIDACCLRFTVVVLVDPQLAVLDERAKLVLVQFLKILIRLRCTAA